MLSIDKIPTVTDTAANVLIGEDARARKLRSLQTTKSLAMLSEAPLTPYSQRHSTDFAQLPQATEETPLSLQLSLHRGRLALLVVLTTVLLILLTLVMRRGIELRRFDRRIVSVSEQEMLLDRYNSYSGTIASALGRPLEIFVAIMVQVIVLWFMTDSALAMATNRRVKMAVLAMGASVGFLLTNGLNALNVQVLELPVKTVMSLSDLQVQNQSNVSMSSTMNESFSERSPKNPTANTILRGLVMPRMAVTSECTNQVYGMAADVVAYGMSQQAWMKQLLPEALTPVSTMKVDLLAKSPQASAQDKLPMNVSVAADLILAAVNSRHSYAAFDVDLTAVIDYRGRRRNYVNDSQSYENMAARFRSVPTTRLAGLLPLNERSTEAQDRAWFLDRYKDFIRSATSAEWRNESLVRWEMEMSRIQLTPSVWVDAITFEGEVIRMDIEQVRWNGSRYYPTSHYYGLSPILRTFEPDVRGPDAQIHAFAVCADGEIDGISTKFDPNYETTSMGGGFCANTSTTSMYVFSSGRHVVADAYLGFRLKESQLYGPGRDNSTAVMTVTKDIRMVYSSTFARVSWKFQNLSELYGASCTDTMGGCLGLDANLSGTDNTKRLLVGATALPLGQLFPIAFSEGEDVYQSQQFEIVSARRPTCVTKAEVCEPDKFWLGDVLLRHNIRHIEEDERDTGGVCTSEVEIRVGNYINNHLYMESTLQPTYTAAAFFLFQNGVVRDVLPQKASASGGVTLELDQNIREMKVWLSTPAVNANLTFAGCIVLVLALCLMLMWPHFTTKDINERLKHLTVTTPHQVARVMLDDTTFPSLLLMRHMVVEGHEGDADGFVIYALSMRPVEADNTANGAVTAG